MHDDQDIPGTKRTRLSAVELAELAGDTVGRIAELTEREVLTADEDGRYDPGDVHRIRVVDGFEAAGVPLDALVKAQEAGLISVAFYDDLHSPPGHPSARTYEAFRASLRAGGGLLPSLFAAFGLAEPDGDSHLSIADEAFLGRLVAQVAATGHADLALRLLRQFGEATRRASEASMDVYAGVIERLGPEFAGVPTQETYDRHFLPWARLARSAPALAGWLTARHITHAIDDYSIRTTEQVLEDAGYVPKRPEQEPSAAFLDLTGFTRLTQEQGDATAAEVALRLADLASHVAAAHGGRVVKLLGDGVLMRFEGVVAAVEASLELLERLAASGLPPGHVGVTQGPMVARDGDIFGRTVNLAARLSDVAPSGQMYVPASTSDALVDLFRVEPVGAWPLAGIGMVELARVTRP
jgi:adenylate cyclase